MHWWASLVCIQLNARIINDHIKYYWAVPDFPIHFVEVILTLRYMHRERYTPTTIELLCSWTLSIILFLFRTAERRSS
jgi:hypothetical protein